MKTVGGRGDKGRGPINPGATKMDFMLCPPKVKIIIRLLARLKLY